MKITTIIFDVDGVLLDSTKKLKEFNKKIAKLLGLRIPKDHEISNLWGVSLEDFVKILWPGTDIEKYRRETKKMFDEGKIKFPPVKDAISTLKKLKDSGFKLSIVTGRSKKYTIKHMEEAGFDMNMFDVIISSEDTKNHKPNPDPILYAFNFLRVKPENTIYVGDSIFDYKSAKNAKVEFVAVLTGDVREKEFRENGVKNIITSVAELPKFLKLNLN
jgi:HAD superfamily hydrolase (TIGR01549 family)